MPINFQYSQEEEAFRREVIRFIEEEPPENFPVQTENECFGFGCWSYEYTRRMAEKGWIGITFPKQYGGLGLPPIYQFIFIEEMAYHMAPGAGHFFAYTAGRALINHGTEAQKMKFLPGMARGDIHFWQALSEPDAGSDLLNCKTKAVRQGDYYVIDGQKTWGSRAHRANHAWLLVTTDPNLKEKGLSLFLVDMKTPGLTLRPIKNLPGDDAFFELYLDSVKVPAENLLGKENRAIDIVIPSLEADRFWARSARIAYCRRILDELLAWLARNNSNGDFLTRDTALRNEIIDRTIELEAARLLSYRTIFMLSSGKRLSYEGSVTKLMADELGRRIAATARGIIGRTSLLEESEFTRELGLNFSREYIYSIGHGLAGGTFEMQKNTIATRGLGLPAR